MHPGAPRARGLVDRAAGATSEQNAGVRAPARRDASHPAARAHLLAPRPRSPAPVHKSPRSACTTGSGQDDQALDPEAPWRGGTKIPSQRPSNRMSCQRRGRRAPTQTAAPPAQTSALMPARGRGTPGACTGAPCSTCSSGGSTTANPHEQPQCAARSPEPGSALQRYCRPRRKFRPGKGGAGTSRIALALLLVAPQLPRPLPMRLHEASPRRGPRRSRQGSSPAGLLQQR
mmetsp:Transcript_81341/g.242417  ORF Transcript_81341/g.242417 Transcript_81341/m.242417 type:complete len:231 (-) Transcript_81341:551-1243(-)